MSFYVESKREYDIPRGFPESDGPWGVYETYCSRCKMLVVQVALVRDVEMGFADVGRFAPVVCTSCENKPNLN